MESRLERFQREVPTINQLIDERISLGSGATTVNLPLFNVESYGAVGDGITDDYLAIREAWDDMLASPVGGLVYFPKARTYRVDGSITSRLNPTADKARALFPLPMILSATQKKVRGLLGVGNPYAVRMAELGGTPGQVNTASVLFVDYGNTYTWSETTGLPCIIGGPDADMTDFEGNTFSNIHFSLDGLIIRNSNNPSLCALNLEQISTVELGINRIDVESVLDNVPEPTNPTGAAVLLPRSNNNVSVSVDKLIVEGHYTGIPITEHIDLRSAIALRCKIGVANRRPCSHYGRMQMLKIEQCQFGFAGYDPSGAAPNLGVVAWKGWSGIIDFVDVEDYAYNGDVPWIYTPVSGSHIYDPENKFNGMMHFGRINSEPPSPTGIGIGTGGGSSSIYVIGASGTNSPIAIYGYSNAAATRVLGNAPENPITEIPDAPTIGSAVAGNLSATVTFTPNGDADTYTVTSTPGGITATGSSSPIIVTGLTAGVSYTFTVHASNVAGNSAESAASNSVVPTEEVAGLPEDSFNRVNAGSLGVADIGGAWLGDPAGTWEIISNKAEGVATGVAWNPAWLDTGQTDMLVQADFVFNERESGIVARVVDSDHLYYLDFNFESSNSASGRIYMRNGTGSFTPLGDIGFTIPGMIAGQLVRLKLKCQGNTLTAYVNKGVDLSIDNEVQQVVDSTITGEGAGIATLSSVAHTIVDNFVVTDP